MRVGYQSWIEENASSHESAYGNCYELCFMMSKKFPALLQVRGHYNCPIWGKRTHWWLKTIDGEIVDPSAKQFPSKGTGVYEEWVEGQEEPTGMCPNCSGFVYGGGTCCSDACHSAYAAYCIGAAASF